LPNYPVEKAVGVEHNGSGTIFSRHHYDN